MNILLTPKKISSQETSKRYSSQLSIVFNFDESESLRNAAARLDFKLGGDVSSINASIDPEHPHAQGYSIKTNKDGINIKAQSEAGVYYGLQFINWIRDQSQNTHSCFQVEDWPDLETRGFMLDISRCKVPKIKTLFQLIDTLTTLRYNQLQLYTEHTFAYKNHQMVWKDASPYSAEEIQTIDAYCKERFIELVPNQNSFGHLERWLRHDEYKHLAECPDGYTHPLKGKLDHGGTLKPTPESIAFIESLYDELLPNFSSNQINIGCDETWELGHGWSAEKISKSSKRKVYLEFLLELNETAKRKNHRIQYWGDIILESPELIPELPLDGTAVVWGYEINHPFEEQCAAFRKAGIPYLVAPGTSSWNTIGGRYENAKQNIEDGIQQAIANQATGFLLTDWGDDGHHHCSLISLPAIARAATIAWNKPPDVENSVQQIVSTIASNDTLFTILERLGRLPDLFQEKPHNCSPLNRILFSSLEACSLHLEKTSFREIENAAKEIEKIRSELSSLHATELRPAIELSLDLLSFACQKGLTILSQSPFPNNQSDEAMSEIGNNYSRQWLASNRPGGLDESLEKLLTNNRLD